MKLFTMIVTFFLVTLTLTFQLYGTETQVDFVRTSGGGYLDDDMYTTASGINGAIHWVCDLPSYKSGTSSTYYHMTYLIDDVYDNTLDNMWMPQTSLNSGTPPDYLRIEFPEAVYLTKIRTYNVAYDGIGSGAHRWMESFLTVSSNGVDYTQVGDVAIDDTPNYHDYVDITINAWVQYIEYQPYEDGDNTPNFYGIAEIMMFMDDSPVIAPTVPEPASILLICISLIGYGFRKTRR